MSTINTNVAALIAQNGLARSQTSLNVSLQRLSTGLKINSGADDPAGLIASQNLQSEIAGINSAPFQQLAGAERHLHRGCRPHQRLVAPE